MVASVTVIEEASVAAMADDDDDVDDEADGMIKDEAQLNDAKIMETTERSDMLRRGGCVGMVVRCGCANAMMIFSVFCYYCLEQRIKDRPQMSRACSLSFSCTFFSTTERAKSEALISWEKVSNDVLFRLRS